MRQHLQCMSMEVVHQAHGTFIKQKWHGKSIVFDEHYLSRSIN